MTSAVTIACQVDFYRNSTAVSAFISALHSKSTRIVFTHCVHNDAVYKGMVQELEAAGWEKDRIVFAAVDDAYKARPDLVRDPLVVSTFDVQVSGLLAIKRDLATHPASVLLVAGDRPYLLRVGKFIRQVMDDGPRLYALPPMDAAIGGGVFYRSLGMIYDRTVAMGSEFSSALEGAVDVVAVPMSLPPAASTDAVADEKRKGAREKYLPSGIPEDAFVFGCLSAPVPESRLDHAIELFLVACVSVEKAYMVLYTHGAGPSNEAYADLADLVQAKCAGAAQTIVANRYRSQREEKGDAFQPPAQSEVDEQVTAVQRELLSRFCIITRSLSRDGLAELACACDLGVACSPSPTYDLGATAFALSGVGVLVPASPYYRNFLGGGAWFDKISLPTRETSWIEAKGGKPSHDTAIITFQAVPSADEHGSIVRSSRIPEIKNAFNIVVDSGMGAYEDLAQEVDTADGEGAVTYLTPQKPIVLASGFVISHQVKTYAEALQLAERKMADPSAEGAVQIAIQCKENAAFVFAEVVGNVASPLLSGPVAYATTRVLDPAFAVVIHTQHVVRAFEIDLQKAAQVVANICKAPAAERQHLGRIAQTLAQAACDGATHSRKAFFDHLDGKAVDAADFPVHKVGAVPLPEPPAASTVSNSTRLLPGTKVEAPPPAASGDGEDSLSDMPPLGDLRDDVPAPAPSPAPAPAPAPAKKKTLAHAV